MKRKDTTSRLWFVLACVLVGFLAGCGGMGNGGRISTDDLREQIIKLPMLYTVEAEVEVLVEGHGQDGLAEWKSFFGQRDIIVPVRANLKAGIDLTKLTDVSIEGDRVYITLPDPVIEIESTEIPWEEVVTSVTGLRDKFSAKEKEFLTRKGRIKILEEMSALDLIAPAQDHAEQIVTNFLNSLGLKPVFQRPNYSEKEIIRFVKE